LLQIIKGLKYLGFNPGRGKRFFSLHLDQFWEPPSLVFKGYKGSFPGVKRLGLEVQHSSPSAAKVKSDWNYTCSCSYDFVLEGNIFTLSVLALPSALKDDVAVVAHHERTSSSDIHTLIGISLVLGFVFMLLVDQCSVSRSRGKLKK
jgi:hypothetical protein